MPGYSPYYAHRYDTFRQAVRRYRPTQLLPALAIESIRLEETPKGPEWAACPPWALAAAARESVLFGNEYRDSTPTPADVLRLGHAFNQIHDSREGDDPLELLTRVAHEQFSYQEPDWTLVGRTHAMVLDGLSSVQGLEVVSEQSLSQLIGCPLSQAVGARFALYVGARMHGGWVDPGWLAQPNFVEVWKQVPLEAFHATIEALTASLPEIRALPLPAIPAGLERYGFNPLVVHPLVQLGATQLLAPVPRFLLWAITPASLFYAGLATHGDAFARDLGRLTEHYVGRQLSLLSTGRVRPEIRFRDSEGEHATVDFIVEWPTLLLLVEVKSSRFRLADRAGGPEMRQQMDSLFGFAKEQITRTAKWILEGAPHVAGIPSDRPILGLVVTAEPYYLANSVLYDPPEVAEAPKRSWLL